MAKEIHPDSNQVFLFPPSLDEWITPDHPARFIADFVDALDLSRLGFSTPSSNIGRPTYSDVLLLRVVLYCYFIRVRSMREMERACHDNVALVWLTGRNTPDHNTLWRFWKRNRKAIRGVFKQSVRIAADQGLVGLVLHAIDGTKIHAQGSSANALSRRKLAEALSRIDAVVRELEAGLSGSGEAADGFCLPEHLSDAKTRREQIKAALDLLQQNGTSNLQPSDPEARLMKVGNRKAFAYNAQAVVDEKAGIVVAADASNRENDYGQLAPMLDQVEENLGRTADTTVADCGYSAAADLAAAEPKGNVVTNLPKSVYPEPGTEEFHVSRFVFDEENNCFICPLGQILPFQRTKRARRGSGKEAVYHCPNWRTCPRRHDCCSNKRGRIVSRSKYHKTVCRQRDKLADPESKALLRRRSAIVEPLFAHVKANDLFRRWSHRGVEAIQAQWALICTIINLKKIHQAQIASRLVAASS